MPAQGSLAPLLGALEGWLRKDRRPPGCGASTRLPTSPASRQRSVAQECIDAWSDHASSYWLRWTDDSSNTHAYHGAYLPLGAYPLNAPSTLRQHARIRPALESLRACGREMGTRNPPPEPLDSAAIAEDVPCTGERGFRVGGVGNLPRGRMTVGAYARVCSTFTWGGKSRVSPRSTTRSPPW